jgi:predicted nucleic acid-binding protein
VSLFVVDASVGMKWFVPEVFTPDALRLRGGGHALHVPTLFDVEVANILWK